MILQGLERLLTGFSSRGPMFDSQNTHGSLHPVVTPVKEEPMLSSGLSGSWHAYSNTNAYMHFNCFFKRGHFSNKHMYQNCVYLNSQNNVPRQKSGDEQRYTSSRRLQYCIFINGLILQIDVLTHE